MMIVFGGAGRGRRTRIEVQRMVDLINDQRNFAFRQRIRKDCELRRLDYRAGGVVRRVHQHEFCRVIDGAQNLICTMLETVVAG